MSRQQTMNKHQQIVEYLADHPVFGPYVHGDPAIDPLIWPYTPPPVLPNIEDVVGDMVADTRFRALRLGSWLGTTDGQIIAEAVGYAIPPQYAAAYQLAVEGLTLGAEIQQTEGRQTAGAFALVVVIAALLATGGEAA